MTFIPDLTVMVSFSIACFVLFITPGPDMSLFLAKTISGGRKAGIASLIGAEIGCTVHTVLAAFGVSALLHASETAFLVLKIVGGLYLLWLAYNAIRKGSAFSVHEEKRVEASFWKNVLTGIGINLANPKVVLFFVTFLPQFVHTGDPHATGKLFFLGIYFVVFSLPLSLLLIFAASKVINLLHENPKVLRTMDYTFAGIFGAFAMKILTLAR
jgi:Putative threonine efflux protein